MLANGLGLLKRRIVKHRLAIADFTVSRIGDADAHAGWVRFASGRPVGAASDNAAKAAAAADVGGGSHAVFTAGLVICLRRDLLRPGSWLPSKRIIRLFRKEIFK